MRRTTVVVMAVLSTFVAVPGAARATAADTASVFLLQGIVGSTWELRVDGEVVGDALGEKGILGPLELEPGRHEVAATSDTGEEAEATVNVRAGQDLDVVLHLPVDASGAPVFTSFVNDRSSVPVGDTRLSIAHTAAVGPADIVVDGEVLFSDVASGEELTVVVPADTYRVAVRPAAGGGPPVLGPVDLTVRPGRLVRVFAIGVASEGTMDAVVHDLPVGTRGSSESPRDIPGGASGPPSSDLTRVLVGWGGAGALVGAVLLGAIGLRRRHLVSGT